MAAERILVYHVEEQKLKKLVYLMAVRLKMKCKIVEYKDYNKTIDQLLHGGGEELADYDGEDMKEPMLVMEGISGRRMDELLRTLTTGGIGTIDLKAVVTPHNVNWDSMTLYRELESEHAKLHGQKES